jgi:hypothetical protein
MNCRKPDTSKLNNAVEFGFLRDLKIILNIILNIFKFFLVKLLIESKKNDNYWFYENV